MDKDFFAEQVLLRGDTMYRVAYTLLHNPDDCRDAMQEATLKAWEKRDGLRDEARFSAWLTRILINECYDQLRKRKRVTVPIEDAPEPVQPPKDPLLKLALEALPENLRLPMVLKYAEGMDIAEISQVLKLPQPTVRGRIHRAKLQLRKELEEE